MRQSTGPTHAAPPPGTGLPGSLVFVAFAVAIGLAPVALAQDCTKDTCTTYDINFTDTSGSGIADPTGSFIYDSTIPTFISFNVTWDGLAFDLTNAAIKPSASAGTTISCTNGSTLSAAESLILLMESCTTLAGPIPYQWKAIGVLGFATFEFNHNAAVGTADIYLRSTVAAPGIGAVVSSSGTWTITPVSGSTSLPEPSALILLSGNLGALAFVYRTRLARRLRRDAKTNR